MEERVKKIYERLQKREYRNLRRVEDVALSNDCKQISDLALRSARRLYELVAQEQAVLFEEDRIGMMRTITSVPPLLQEEEQKALYLGRFVFDSAQVGNISSDYEGILADGFLKKRALIYAQKEKYATDSKQFKELEAMNVCIDAILLLAEKYRAEAEKMGNTRLAEALKRVPMYAPNGYYEALVMMRMINFTLWLNANKTRLVGLTNTCIPIFSKTWSGDRSRGKKRLRLHKSFSSTSISTQTCIQAFNRGITDKVLSSAG